jgi:hypothetical protein
MIILYVLIGIIALLLLVAALIGTGWSYEKSIRINAPADKVWGQASSLKAPVQWSPWIEKDPGMQ